MSRLRSITVAAVATAFAVTAAPATAHKGSPDFESTITAVTGLPDGVDVSVLNRDDSLSIVNRSDETVVLYGYESEPYARIDPDGTVAVNQDSTATYLNEDRYGKVTIPDGVDSKGPARWKTLDRSGRFAWHDHRIHWMASGRPPQVKDPDVRTKVFDWKIDLRAGDRPATIRGVLEWTPRDDGGAPVAAIVGFAVLLLGSLIFVVLVRRRRRDATGAATQTEKESW